MITTDAMNELCQLLKTGDEFTAEVFDGWVGRYYAMPGNGGPGSLLEPRSMETSRVRVHAFDAFLSQPSVVDCRFTRAIIALRNVFALHAGMSTPVTVVLGLELSVQRTPVRATKAPTFAELFSLLIGSPDAQPSC